MVPTRTQREAPASPQMRPGASALKPCPEATCRPPHHPRHRATPAIGVPARESRTDEGTAQTGSGSFVFSSTGAAAPRQWWRAETSAPYWSVRAARRRCSKTRNRRIARSPLRVRGFALRGARFMLASSRLGSLGKLLIIFDYPKHRSFEFWISHLFSTGAGFLGAVTPVLWVVNE